MERRNLPAAIGMPIILLAVIIGGVLLAAPVEDAGLTAFEDPESMANPFIFLAIILIFTSILLLLIRAAKQNLISLIIGGAILLTYVYVFSAILNQIVGGFLTIAGAIALAGVSGALLFWYPRWYVINCLGIVLASGVAAIFGASLSVLPVIMLLSILAIYDWISVYRTKHMITLAEGVIEQKMPILFVIPKERGYTGSYEKIADAPADQNADHAKKERGTFLMGMGDAIMPAILVVSAFTFIGNPVPAAGAAIGTFIGLAVLLRMVFSGQPQAGLPPLNGGAILGFLAGCALVSEWSWVLAL